MIFKDQNVFETPVFFEIEDAVAKGPKYVFDLLWRKRRQRGVVVIGLDNYFVRADAIHLVEHAFGLSVEIAFNSEGREFVGNDPNGPAWRIPLRSSPVVAGPIGLNFRRCLAFVSVTKRAE